LLKYFLRLYSGGSPFAGIDWKILLSFSLPSGKLICRWVDNVKIDFREIGWGGVDWIDMAQDRDQWRALVNTALNLQVP
jgi:hypothetical protein